MRTDYKLEWSLKD